MTDPRDLVDLMRAELERKDAQLVEFEQHRAWADGEIARLRGVIRKYEEAKPELLAPWAEGASGWTVVRVLEELRGKPWDAISRSFMRALRPSKVRVVPFGGDATCDAVTWRVTVWLEKDGTVDYVEQEVEVDLPDGIANGYELQMAVSR